MLMITIRRTAVGRLQQFPRTPTSVWRGSFRRRKRADGVFGRARAEKSGNL